MSSNVPNQAPFLRTTRTFPQDSSQALSVEIDRSYIDIANAVNNRTISIYSTDKPMVNGESWFLDGGNSRRQALRKVYSITSLVSFSHGINFSDVYFFSDIRGIGFDGTNYYPIPFVDGSTTTTNVGIYVNPTDVIVLLGATPPGFVSGIIILEWITNT